MARPRKGNTTGRVSYRKQLHQAIAEALPHKGLPLCVEDRRVRWTPRLLAVTALLMVWQKGAALGEAFEAAREQTVAMYASRRRPGVSLQGFCDRLRGRSAELIDVLRDTLQWRTQKRCGRRWRWGQWVVLGVDGTRIDTPRTAANEAAFGCAGKARTAPQIQLTCLFHLASGLLWNWRRGAGTTPERQHLREMLNDLPAKTLLVGDAGFAGYDLMQSLLERGHGMLIRAGSGFTLLRDLERAQSPGDDWVHLWPVNQRHRSPLKLRLIKFKSNDQTVCLLTSLDAEALPLATAKRLYKMRWTVEVGYRSLKQTLHQRKMLAQSPEVALAEVDWAVTAQWMLGLLASRHQRVRDLGRTSVAGALRTVRRAMRRGDQPAARTWLAAELRAAVIDRYERRRPKTARDWPAKKRQHPPSPPNIRTARQAEKAQYQRLKASAA